MSLCRAGRCLSCAWLSVNVQYRMGRRKTSYRLSQILTRCDSCAGKIVGIRYKCLLCKCVSSVSPGVVLCTVSVACESLWEMFCKKWAFAPSVLAACICCGRMAARSSVNGASFHALSEHSFARCTGASLERNGFPLMWCKLCNDAI